VRELDTHAVGTSCDDSFNTGPVARVQGVAKRRSGEDYLSAHPWPNDGRRNIKDLTSNMSRRQRVFATVSVAQNRGKTRQATGRVTVIDQGNLIDGGPRRTVHANPRAEKVAPATRRGARGIRADHTVSHSKCRQSNEGARQGDDEREPAKQRVWHSTPPFKALLRHRSHQVNEYRELS
jgi:hypothetical protein